VTAKKRRILVAEDSATQAERIRFLLEAQGFRVDVARHGREGLESVKARPPDLIISDVVMPEMDGFAFCRAVKSAPATKRIPFVLLTTQQTPMDILHGLERGADNFITKPFEDEFLLERIKRIFENLESRQKGALDMEVTVRLAGREIVVNADKQQMIELLFSTSEELSDSNRHLEEARLALEEQARDLERKVQERTRALQEAEGRYRTLLEQMPAVVYVSDHERVDRLIYISPQIEGILGFSVAEWMADADLLARQLHPGDRERFLAELRRLRATSEPVSTEFRMLARDGRVVWFSDQIRVVGGEDGSRRVQGFLLDITERKRAEAELRRQREFLRQVVDTSPSFIFAKDRQGRFTLVNAAVAEAYGTTVESLLGKTDADFNPRTEEVEAFRRDDLEVMDSGRERVIPEEVITDASGKRRWLLTVKRPLLGPDGRSDQILGVSTDITERRLTEDQLRQSQKIEAVGHLAGGVAHDFNNLLGVITGYADLLLKDIGAPHPGARRVHEIRKAADRATALTRQLLAFSRKQVLQPRVLDLNAAVGDMEKMLGRLIGEDIQIIAKFGTELGRVKADPGQIEQVIMNLAVNARDAMPHGGKLILETTNVELDENYLPTHPGAKPGPHVLLAVSDTGHGIDAETLPRIFEPFFTTKEQGKGTGLGLSTVYGIVKQSGGYIMVYSEPGHGTTFKVYLPRVDEEAAAAAGEVPAEPLARASETILLVEDEKPLREMIHEILEEGGYTVLEGGSPEEALAAARSHPGPIHLMLTDVVMPRMGGRDLAAEMAAVRPDLRVLYMSGYTDNAIVHHGVLDAGTHFLQKPFTADALLRKARAVLDEPRGER
jgi:two-component system, cell cycle sensor histidine kinase and response regulator CckA